MSLGGSSVAVVQLPGGQFQVQGVIQSAQPSVIQSPHGQTAQVRPTMFLFFLCQQLQLMNSNNHELFFIFLRLLDQIAKTLRTHRTAEQQLKKPEKY